jgi:hypothetical protein
VRRGRLDVLKQPPRSRNRLVAVERIVKIAAGVVAVVTAVVTLYFKIPGLRGDNHPTKTPSTLAASLPVSPISIAPTIKPTTVPTTVPTSRPTKIPTKPITYGPTTTPVTKAPPKPSPVLRTFDLNIPVGIAFDLEDPNNNGFDGNDPGYGDRDLYRTSKTSPGNQLQGVQVPVTSSSFNPVVAMPRGSVAAACKALSTTSSANIPLGSATDGTTFCVKTRAGHWAQVVITDANQHRSAPDGVRVTLLTR